MYTSKDYLFKELFGSFIDRNIDNYIYIYINNVNII